MPSVVHTSMPSAATSATISSRLVAPVVSVRVQAGNADDVLLGQFGFDGSIAVGQAVSRTVSVEVPLAHVGRLVTGRTEMARQRG